MPFDRYSSARLCAGEILLVLGVLVLATPFAHGESSTSNATQTVIADSNSNGLNSPGGLAVARDENIFIVDTGNNRVGSRNSVDPIFRNLRGCNGDW
jgi:hypothetical protein